MAGQFTFYAGLTNGTVGSLIAVLDSILLPQGWTKPYTGTNLAAYRSAGTHPTYLNVQDNAPTSATEAWLTGYETMSAVNTGTGAYPNAPLGNVTPNGAFYVCRKSATADSTVRVWRAYADAATLYLFIQADGFGGSGNWEAFFFGLFDSLAAGDAYANLCIGRNRTGSTNTYDCADLLSGLISLNGTDAGAGVADRSYTGVASPVGLRRVGDAALIGGAQQAMGIGLVPFPNNPDGKIYVSPVRAFETTQVYRGTYRGLWSSCHPVASFNDGDTWSGTGSLGGKTFQVVKPSSNGGLFIVETSATLTNP